MNLLLHTCCAPCSVYCIKSLRAENIEPTLFWYNPNIHPYSEYKARRDCLKDYAKSKKVKLILEDAYGLDDFVCGVLNAPTNNQLQPQTQLQAQVQTQTKAETQTQTQTQTQKQPQAPDNQTTFQSLMQNRCANFCYPKRPKKVFEYAKEHGYDAVSTTLLYSIYQQHDIIKDLMEHLAKEYKIKFLYRDFRKGWHEGQEEARKASLYMQKYCGCIFSEEESMIGREIGKKLKKSGVSPTNANVRKVIEENKIDNLIKPGNITI